MLRIKEPINSISHLIGAILSVIGLIFMIYKSVINHSGLQLGASITFGVSLILLYSASTIYHWVNSNEKVQKILRRIDHSMIYVLIAGTYTPICLVALKGVLGISIFTSVWVLAIVGIVLKFLWTNAPRWVYTSFYLFLGWISVFFIVPIYKSIPFNGFLLLVIGGLLYTIGAVIYGTKSKKINIFSLGFHEIFHIFILLGSLSHFLMVSDYILI